MEAVLASSVAVIGTLLGSIVTYVLQRRTAEHVDQMGRLAVRGHENIRGQLVERGIQPNTARKAAMFQLAGEIPTPILAGILGLGTHTAVRWAALAARDWSKYTALRRQDALEHRPRSSK